MGFKKKYTALYGKIGLMKEYCSQCQQYAFIVDNIKQCCDQPASDDLSTKVKQETPTIGNRKRCQLTLKQKKELLDQQANKCIYCGHLFGTFTVCNGLDIQFRIQYDHLTPHSYCQSNDFNNMAAACQICNNIKSSHMFNTIEEARVMINTRLHEKGYTHQCLD